MTLSTNGISLRYARHGSGQFMAIEHACVRVVRKPWGVADLHPWSGIDGSGDQHRRVVVSARRSKCIRPRPCCSSCCLPVSHCRSRFIRTMLLRARSVCRTARPRPGTFYRQSPDARVAVGLKRRITPQRIARLDQGRLDCRPRSMAPGFRRATSSSFLPARSTPSARGIVLAEIQQHSDATFRLVRLWAAARTARRQRRRRFRCRAGSNAIQFTTPYG